MDAGGLHELIDDLLAADPSCADRQAFVGWAEQVARLQAFCDDRKLFVATGLGSFSARPENDLADAGRMSVKDANAVIDRAATVEAVPEFGAALGDGAITAAHVDVITRAMRTLEAPQRSLLAERAGHLVGEAQVSTAKGFGLLVRAVVRELQSDGGMGEYERQCLDTGLSTWTDAMSGMFMLSGRFDPKTGAILANRLKAMTDTVYAEQVPDGCPKDARLKQDWLRAHALIALTEGNGTSKGAVDAVIVLNCADTQTDGAPAVDLGIDADLPDQVIADWLAGARIWPVVIDERRRLVYAAGQLDLGRSTRLANRAQRRALQGFHPTCVVPGCAVKFVNCKIHHLVAWEHGGTTDLHNLVPLCTKHHAAVHTQGWTIRLKPDRTVEIDIPGQPNAPPGASAA